jgi:hypothetical protein
MFTTVNMSKPPSTLIPPRRLLPSLTNPVPLPLSSEPLSPSLRRQSRDLEISESSQNENASISDLQPPLSPLDPEMQEIVSLTAKLQQGVCSQLQTYKRLSHQYAQQHDLLQNKVRLYQDELDSVKHNVYGLLSETTETHKFIKDLRENTSNKETRLQTEENMHSSVATDERILEVSGQLDINEESRKVQKEKEEHLSSSRICRMDGPKKSECGCIVV